ncbi:MAG: serine/threonine-protein kinase [Polyangiales bacterium]
MSTHQPTELLPADEAKAALDAAKSLPLLATEAFPSIAIATPPAPAQVDDTPPPGWPEPGKTFHNLTVHSKLGEGGMGAAFLASHPVLRMPLVIKTFKLDAGDQIFREAHLAARVSSTHVVGAVDAGIENGVPFVVQRYVDGIDLEEILASQRAIGRRLPVEAVCRLVVDAALGLHAIHQAGVVHRDVKPANLFLCGNGTAAVGDFGIAVESRSRGVDNRIVGTPHFMAPEQWNQAAIDRRTDLYALGATAHMLTTNESAFQGESAIQLGIAHVTAVYAPPPPRDPREAYLFAVIDRLLRKRPEDRYASAEAVARALSVVTSAPAPVKQRDELRARAGDVSIELVFGDLAQQEADVIVNAANGALVMDAGVAAVLRRVGGDQIEKDALEKAPVAMGDVVWTAAGDLKAHWVAHAVAALDNAICLQRCTLRVLLEAEARRCESVAFPALGTGIGGVPMALGAKLLLEAVRTFSTLEPDHVRDVRVVLFDPLAMETWADVLQSM